MRTTLLPLTALVAVVAGCGSGVREPRAPSLPQRDLTLATQAARVEIASPVEVQQLRLTYRTIRHSQRVRPTPAPRSSSPEPNGVLAAVSAAAPVAAEPVAQPAASANDRELLPGKTVTLIPVSSGPSAAPDPTDDIPAARGHTIAARGGGRCGGRGRGPGIGIAGAPRPDFR
ncbi:MAG: hypothetical protein ABI785_08690 [Gemmatimonadales bacterium]